MPFISAETIYVVADSILKKWSQRVLNLNGGGNREGSFK
jgi:hypothetical protein